MSALWPTELTALYEERRNRFATELSHIQKKIRSISNLRLAAALISLLLLYAGFSDSAFFPAMAPFAAGFVALVIKHNNLYRAKSRLENLVFINAGEVASLQGDRSALHTGHEFIDVHHPHSHDLDIFGDGSLYQLMNRAHTLDGRRAVANLLTSPSRLTADVLARQQAVEELRPLLDFRQDLEAAALEINELPADREQLLAWLAVPPITFTVPYITTLLWVLPVLTIAAWTLFTLSVVPAFAPYSLTLAQWLLWGRFSKKINLFHDFISRKKMILEKYAYMLSVIRGDGARSFQAELLRKIGQQADDAGEKVSQLASLVSQLNARLNFLTALVANGLLLYDIRSVYRLEKWKHDHGARLHGWLEAIAQAEALSSLANFAFNHPHCHFPTFHNDITVRASGMGHPLLSPSECVVNDVTLGPAPYVMIVTGANMAGKSTFLRALGVNVVLAHAGAPVYAAQFEAPLIPLRTGMRTADSLKDHESYFYAELNRLKSIIDDLRSGQPLLILLDEILKGTNSNDKQKGSIALIRQLLEYPALSIVATHDLALGEIHNEYPTAVRNYCFEATIKDEQLLFDYKLKPGLAKNMNATFLMKKMGIIKK